jgi:D-aminoacyl-tRNA deacylase
MRVVIQRVNSASLSIDKEIYSYIAKGLLILIGVENEDTKEDAEWLSKKIVQLRIFGDDNDLMNLSLQDIDGEILVVSQFTLYASTKKGNRPSFIRSAKPSTAEPLYEYFIQQLSTQVNKEIKRGVFGADMMINLVNDGPVTIVIDTKQKE